MRGIWGGITLGNVSMIVAVWLAIWFPASHVGEITFAAVWLAGFIFGVVALRAGRTER